MDARSVATQVLTRVITQHCSLTESLPDGLSQLPDPRERALTQALCYGVLRWLPKLQAICQQLLRNPLRERDTDIQVLLFIGLFQQLYLRIPDHAVISATVNVARTLQKKWAVALVNAVLRNFQRQRETLLARLEINAQLAHPAWLLDRLQTNWPEHWQTIVEANNSQPPLVLRVNQRRSSRTAYLHQLREAQIEAKPIAYVDSGVTLEQAVEIPHLPGFAQGVVSVQDGGAQLVAALLDVPTGARVLDACAAPGGKTLHLLERYEINKLVALDKDAHRVAMIHDNLQRLGLTAEVLCADATQPQTWWDGQLFDRILLDVPCSGSGIIRRHPDIKYLKQVSDIKALAQQQRKLLETLWHLLAPNGILLYVTCSVFAKENYLQLQRFLETHQEAHELKIVAEWGYPMPIGRQILPSADQPFDGFYYARLVKN